MPTLNEAIHNGHAFRVGNVIYPAADSVECAIRFYLAAMPKGDPKGTPVAHVTGGRTGGHSITPIASLTGIRPRKEDPCT